MTKLKDVADVIRSKNAGPFVLTFDIFFHDPQVYQKVKKQKCINEELIKRLYRVSNEEILSIVYFDVALAIKFNLKRKICSGDFGDRDIYGAQQHVPLFEVELFKEEKEED